MTGTFLPYTLTLRAPAIASALSGDPNSAATQPFIPGGTIRGAVAARLLAEGASPDSDVFRDLILTGAVRYLHAYPEIDGQRAMPVPQSWRSDKAQPTQVRDLAAFDGRVTEDDDAEDFGERWPGETLVAVRGLFTAQSVAGGARSVAASLVDARAHQQRDRVKGRPWTEHVDGREVPRGAIFVYEYLEPGQVFRGLVQVNLSSASIADTDRLVELRERYTERLQTLLQAQPILVGRSRRAGYGGDAEIQFHTRMKDAEYADVSGALAGDPGLGQFRMLLVSAYVGRNPVTGQFDPAALACELHPRGLTIERRCWSRETVGSFNRKWRLEVPQATAVTAGSVFVLRSDTPIQLAILRSIEREGLGERRAEGFGRVLFLRHDEQAIRLTIRRAADAVGMREPAEAGQGMPTSVADQLAFVQRRIVLATARRELDRVAADLAGRAQGLPTTSLLSRIRTIFRTVHDKPSASQALGDLRTWCDDDGGVNALKPEARKKLMACRVSSETLLEWLGALGRSDCVDQAWRRLVVAAGTPSTLNALAQRHYLTTSVEADEILNSHAAELTVHLIDGVLARMARRNRGADR